VAVRDPLAAAVHRHSLTAARPAIKRSAKSAKPATLPAGDGPELARAEAILGHRFANPALLREALTHRSAARHTNGARHGSGSNERLEFVGDRVLGLLVAEWLAERFPGEQEGELGIRLAHLVSQPVLAGVAEEVLLPDALNVSEGETRAGVRRRATVLADAMEAALGALYLDGGIEPARRFVRRAWEAVMTAQSIPPKDAKTALQEWAQGRGLPLPDYQICSREGPPHAPVFVISVTVDGQTGVGTAGSKRAAEQAAALSLLAQLGAKLPAQRGAKLAASVGA
jgi:ribonuclease-3